ncbi:hypothetical protein AMECASPLE_026245 [Ameca splendens]|uniref:Uncharacterized protein n=1 Tax=Ameca splendens TaxID=208324 RepID=A0ABV0YG15_9TELE
MLLCMPDVHVSCACVLCSIRSAEVQHKHPFLWESCLVLKDPFLFVQNKATHVEVFSLKLSEFFLGSPSLPDAVFYRNIYKPIHHSDAVCSGGPDQPSNQVDG